MVSAPEVVAVDAGDARAVRLWRFDVARRGLSSAPVGGGWGTLGWLANVGVPGDYARVDLDDHAGELARRLGLDGPGQVLLTAADVTMGVSAETDGVYVDATVGVTKPTWAADVDGAYAELVDGAWTPVSNGVTPDAVQRPGTINIVVQLPVPLTPAAAVNAVATATEAKTQALLRAGVPGTGTASDAIAVLWPGDGDPEPFAGPRSPWGARLARAVYDAVTTGIEVHP